MIDPFVSGKEFGASIFDSKFVLWLARVFAIVIVVCLLIRFLFPSVFAIDFQTYNDMVSSNSNVNTLLSLMPVTNKRSHYVVWQNAQNEYILVYGDLTFDNDSIIMDSENPVNFIRSYYDTSGYQTVHRFQYGSYDSFSLDVSHIVTSDLNFDYSSHSLSYESFLNEHFNFYILLIFIPVFAVLLLRRCFKNDLV